MWGRRFSAGLFASVLATGAIALTGVATASAEPSTASDVPKASDADDKLGSHDHELLAQAEAKGERTVTVMVATDKGKAKDVAAELRKLGGNVTKQQDNLGYVRAQVPTANVRKAAKVTGVSAIDLNESIPLPKPEPEAKSADGASAQATLPGPGKDTPAANPYMPTNETGAVAFAKAHPTWDGRGVTIGIMDSGVDLDNPALQTTSTGERKIVDWITVTDPVTEGDGTWRRMTADVVGPAFTIAGANWKAPAGSYKFNLFAESITGPSEVGGDVNRDGDKTDVFGVLYDPVTHDIRVDANQNNDFTDEPAMRPYKEKFQVGHFGADNPNTPVSEQMPFVVEYREHVDLTPDDPNDNAFADYVNIGLVEAMHASHVAGITAAYNMLGNPNFNGAAPGAKLVSARACTWSGGCTAVALFEGMMELVVNRHVDVVNMSIGGLPALNDGNNARAELYNRLINDYGVQMFISAGNSGPGVNTVGDPSVATDVVSVAASVSKDTWLANYGSVVRKSNNLFNFSSRGPREDGGFKPNIAAPGSAIATAPMWQPGAPAAEAGYSLPPGYQMINGTSMASPQATGAATLLLSAAKATDKGVTPAAMRRAIYTSAKPIADVPAYAQGYGMFDVNGAWNLLRSGVETRSYQSDAPVCTPISDLLKPKNRGTGIYNRCAVGKGGQKAGESKKYTVKLTRTSGPDKDVKHVLRWVGNDGTFKSDRTVDLPLNKTVKVEVEAKPGVGVHSAILEVDDPRTSTVDFEVLNTVVASNDTKAPAYSYSTQGTVDRNSFKSYFVTVPQGASALQVNLSGIATGSQTRFIAFNPYGVPVESTSSLACYTNFSNPAECKPQERDYQNPIPGIWEIEVEARRTSPALENPFQLTTRMQGLTVAPSVLQLPSVTAGQSTPVSWTVKNDFGPVKVSGQGGPLGSEVKARPTIKEGEHHKYQVVVPAGTTKFTAVIGKPSVLSADLDLFVRLNGVVVGQSADGDSEEAVTLVNPAPGTYEVDVHGYGVAGPGTTTEYDYRDVFYASSLGSISVPATVQTLANGATGAVSGSVTAQSAPAAGRTLIGEMAVVTDEGAVVGRGNLVIGEVK
jgi:hypothetical protein